MTIGNIKNIFDPETKFGIVDLNGDFVWSGYAQDIPDDIMDCEVHHMSVNEMFVFVRVERR